MPTTRASALADIQTAIDTLLTGDAPLGAELASASSVYDLGTVPKDAPIPLIELGDVGESSFLTFGKGGNRTEMTIVIISPRADGKMRVARIYAHLIRLLENGTLVVAGHVIATSRVTFVTAFNDPNGTHIRGIVRVTLQSLNA